MGTLRSHEFIRFVAGTIAHLGTKFSRQRIWCPRSIFIAVLLLTRARRRTTYRSLMNTFLSDTAALLDWKRRPSLSSLSDARAKLGVDSCRMILRLLAERLATMTPKRFRHPSGRRFIGMDGVHFIAPRSDDTRRTLSPMKYNTWFASHCPQAFVVAAVDLLKRLPLDFVLLPKGCGERVGAPRLAEQFHPGDVAVMDRGFPARWLLGEFVDRQVDFVVRMTTAAANSWAEVADFLRSGKLEAIVPVRIDGSMVPMRLIRRNFRRGRPRRGQVAETMVILTTLTTKNGFNRDAIIKLYAARWGIETVFREMKCEFEIERFHARSVAGIEQEIAAVLAWIGFASAVQFIAEDRLPDNRRVYRTLCFEESTKIMEAILAGRDLNPVLNEAIENVCRYHYTPRAGRSFPRERKSPLGRWKVRA